MAGRWQASPPRDAQPATDGSVPACHKAPLPDDFWDLTAEQALGRACVACGKALGVGAVYRGPVLGRDGAMLLDADVFACPPPAGGR
ncbi:MULTISPECIES: hypothetical protein [Streptomyces]|uniref:hypothetical protein n=1 Tax=Streptomyces TaxID=1883 RepID=UPI00167821D6|nr:MULTISPECIES: hypothetical protein [Streptomyces]MBD3577438.1 hypothetical protein [Streptomyces sp. KD18]GGT00719.1 hypothetical protein GCM10010286_27110 [Streptomyces toxytricini]